MSADVFETMAGSPKFCHYLHMPAQSGSNEVLRAMNRGYTREQYLEKLELARRHLPDVNCTSDFIVGFVNETDAEFDKTVTLMREARFGGSFIFKYSVRPGTQMTSAGDPVPDAVKKARNQILLRLQEDIARAEQAKLHGRLQQVLVEGPSKTDSGKWMGRDIQQRIVVFAAGRDLTGELVNVEITHSTPLTLFARLP